jgi:hypothetical protein
MLEQAAGLLSIAMIITGLVNLSSARTGRARTEWRRSAPDDDPPAATEGDE